MVHYSNHSYKKTGAHFKRENKPKMAFSPEASKKMLINLQFRMAFLGAVGCVQCAHIFATEKFVCTFFMWFPLFTFHLQLRIFFLLQLGFFFSLLKSAKTADHLENHSHFFHFTDKSYNLLNHYKNVRKQ